MATAPSPRPSVRPRQRPAVDGLRFLVGRECRTPATQARPPPSRHEGPGRTGRRTPDRPPRREPRRTGPDRGIHHRDPPCGNRRGRVRGTAATIAVSRRAWTASASASARSPSGSPPPEARPFPPSKPPRHQPSRTGQITTPFIGEFMPLVPGASGGGSGVSSPAAAPLTRNGRGRRAGVLHDRDPQRFVIRGQGPVDARIVAESGAGRDGRTGREDRWKNPGARAHRRAAAYARTAVIS